MGDRKGDSNRRRSLCWAKVRIHHFSGFFLTWWGRSSSFYTLWPRHLSCFFIQTTCIANEISIAVSSLQGSWHSATISNITIILLWRDYEQSCPDIEWERLCAGPSVIVMSIAEIVNQVRTRFITKGQSIKLKWAIYHAPDQIYWSHQPPTGPCINTN